MWQAVFFKDDLTITYPIPEDLTCLEVGSLFPLCDPGLLRDLPDRQNMQE